MLSTIAILASFFVAMWLFFSVDAYLDRREEKRKAKLAYQALPTEVKVKMAAKQVANGAKAVGGVAANGATKVAGSTVKAGAVVGSAVVGGIKTAGKTIGKGATKTVSVAGSGVVKGAKAVGGATKKVGDGAKSMGKLIVGKFKKPNDDEGGKR